MPRTCTNSVNGIPILCPECGSNDYARVDSAPNVFARMTCLRCEHVFDIRLEASPMFKVLYEGVDFGKSIVALKRGQ
jgi:rubredoxin